MLPAVFLTRAIPDAGLDLLRDRVTLRMHPNDRPITRDELREGIADAEGLLCLLTDPVDAEVIASAPALRVISTYAVGYDNIDVEAARARGIVVTNTPGALTDATADIAFALLLACARRIAEADRWVRTHRFDGWAPMQLLGLDLMGATVAIIGAGRIGRAFARRCARAFDMRVLYVSRRPNEELEQETGARRVDLDTALREADAVSLHVPLTPGTRHLIGARELALMKSTAVLINTARGPVVDEAALIDTLQRGALFGAGLDVYEREPDIPEALKALDRVVLLPHIGSASVATRNRMAEMAARQLLDALEGRTPEHRVV